ncbi:MAG: serine/threonine protein kinase [Phycisphaerales bacterium]
MNPHASISELERLRSMTPPEPGSDERPIEEIRTHVESCEQCRTQLDELTKLDDFASQVRAYAAPSQTLDDSSLRLAGYDIGREIHRGGQGIVYAATQLSTGRQVAIKVLLHGSLASEKQRFRFEREIDLAARINHPNVVSIIDRGQAPDGRGYLVMELVDGPTLDGYLIQHELTTQQRLRLFIEIAGAIQAAHQRGILHRDLKPGNIIVDQAGRPRVLDFGLAKDDLEESATVARTVAGEFMGTLAYASPEQLRGDPEAIDARTDIYSLGVLLYEMLTGQLPHDMSGPIESVIRRVREQTPKRPGSINKGLDPDIDTVLLHALEQDPARRYQSADAFADDVLAVIEHRPVHARKASAMYQLRKFTRRHRTGVALSAVVLLGMVGTIGALSVGIVRTNAANRLAEQRRAAAELELEKQTRISDFFNDLLGQVDPGQSGPDMRVLELLHVASNEIHERFERYPDLRGQLQHTVGETYTRLGSYEPGEAQLISAIEAMESLDQTPYAPLGAALGVLAQVQIATTRLDEAESTLTRAIETAGSLPDSPERQSLLAQLTHQHGALLYEQGAYEDSISAYEQLLAEIEGLDTERIQRIRAQTLIGLGVSLKRLERFEEALRTYDEALAILSVVREENHPDTLACLSNRAEVLNNLGRSAEAETQLFDLLERRRAVFGPSHERVGITLNNLADLLRERRDFDQAGELFDQAIEIFRVSPGDPSLRLAITIQNAGVMHLEQGALDRATPQLLEAWEMSSGLLPEGHWIAAQFGTKYAECLMMSEENKRAREILEQALPTLAASLGKDHRRTVHAQSLLTQLMQSN